MILRVLGKALIINSERFKTVMCWSEDFENFLRIRINFELYRSLSQCNPLNLLNVAHAKLSFGLNFQEK